MGFAPFLICCLTSLIDPAKSYEGYESSWLNFTITHEMTHFEFIMPGTQGNTTHSYNVSLTEILSPLTIIICVWFRVLGPGSSLSQRDWKNGLPIWD